jgi:hypothetical protein
MLESKKTVTKSRGLVELRNSHTTFARERINQ